MAIVTDVIKYSHLAWGLREYLHGTITLAKSEHTISTRLRHRERNFLSLIKSGIYQNPSSPFLKLFKVAGCEFGDIESLVVQDGIESTLQKLLAEGVYLSWEEFKGKKEVVRSGQHFHFKPRDFDNPFLPGYYQVQSSGSRSSGTRTIFDLDHHLEMSYYRLPVLAVTDGLDVPLGIWKSVLPAISGISNSLGHWKAGKPVTKWFSPVNERHVRASFRDRLAMRYILYGSRCWGAKLAKPEYVPLEEASRVARWMADAKKQYGGCSLISSVSPAVKVSQAATEIGLDIKGTHFIVSGEPLTDAKRRQIEASGASVIPRYNISEIGKIGCGCPNGGGDDIHIFLDSMALIQHQRKVEHTDLNVNAFLFTPLLPSAPRILINVESDDCGVVETRRCNCLWGELGFNQHLHDIRSFAKLTGSGMTILGSDLVRVLEEVFPHKYGGIATDYQLLEEEDNRGQTRLSLVISPRVGEVDDGDVIATLLNELRRGIYGGKLAAGLWSQASQLQVRRMNPISSAGKVLTLHLMKKG